MCIMLWALGPARLLVQYTLTCAAHICLLYKGTHVYSLIKIYNTIKQPLAVELPTSSSHRPWVPDLQPPSLRSFTLHRPLPFASTLQNIAPIMFVKVPLRSSCADLHTYGSLNAIGDYTRPHAPLHIQVFPHALPRAATSGHALSHASTLPLTSLLMSLACVSR